MNSYDVPTYVWSQKGLMWLDLNNKRMGDNTIYLQVNSLGFKSYIYFFNDSRVN